MKKPQVHSAEHQRFTDLLREVLSVPHDELKRRMDEDRTAKEWSKENNQPEHRARPIVSPAAVASSKSRASQK